MLQICEGRLTHLAPFHKRYISRSNRLACREEYMRVLKFAACAAAALVALAAAAPAAMAGAPAQRLAPPPPPLKKAYATSWEEYQDYLKDAKGGTKKTFAQLPDWSGIWTHAGGFALDPSMPRDKI